MKLSKTQIQDLFAFVRKHYVEHYDLQTELVDHLANGIEEQWKEHPERSFKDARLREFRKFGVYGFEDVIRKRSWVMEKRYWKHIFRFFKEYFKPPKIFLLAVLTCTVFLAIRLTPIGYKLYSIIGFMFIVFGLMMVRAVKNRKKYRAKIGIEKRWMLEEKIFQYGEVLQFMFFPIHLLNLFASKGDSVNGFYIELVMAAISVCYIALCYVMIYVIPKKAEELLAKTYPEYKMA